MRRGFPKASCCGLDTVEIARFERFLAQMTPADTGRLFTQRELDDAGEGPRRAAQAAYAASKGGVAALTLPVP